jgi:DNA-directed RNA polymerase specialized sigma24 family protein
VTRQPSSDQGASHAGPAGRRAKPASAAAQEPGLGSPRVQSLPSDDELAARLRARDEAAFARLVDAWSSKMIRLARSFVSTDDSAAEVVQEAWLAVVEGIAGYEGRSSLRTWVYRILVNVARRRGAREHRSVPWSSLHPADEDDGPTVDPGRFRGPPNRTRATGEISPRRGHHRSSRRLPARSGHKSLPHSPCSPVGSES